MEGEDTEEGSLEEAGVFLTPFGWRWTFFVTARFFSSTRICLAPPSVSGAEEGGEGEEEGGAGEEEGAEGAEVGGGVGAGGAGAEVGARAGVGDAFPPVATFFVRLVPRFLSFLGCPPPENSDAAVPVSVICLMEESVTGKAEDMRKRVSESVTVSRDYST